MRAVSRGLPLRFEPAVNHPGGADFVGRGNGLAVNLTSGGAEILLGPTADNTQVVFDVGLAGASRTAASRGRHLLPGVTNYVVGANPRQWRLGIHSYGEVEYQNIYPGVDVVYYGNQQHLEYDFIVAPGASYRDITLTFGRASDVRIDSHGDLAIVTAGGTVVQHAPAIYQDRAGTREKVAGGYIRRSGNRFGFWVGRHDASLPLVIDPVLTYASYLGGAREERPAGVALDSDGNMYVAGLAGAADFPIAAAPAMTHGRENWDAFVMKLNAAGDQIQYVTYLGGSGYDEPADIDIDPAGNAYIVGTTDSWDFPTSAALQPSKRGVEDSFVAKLGPDGAVIYSTYLGGRGDEFAGGIAVDRFGRAYVTGTTWSPDFPTVAAMQPSPGGHAAFRTSDGGATWTGIDGGLVTAAVVTFAIDPVHSSTMYAGTSSDGVFKSADGGSTWTRTSTDLPAVPVNAMAAGPDGVLYVANDAGLYRTDDRGASWVDLQLWTPVSAVGVDRESGSVYIGLSSGFPGVFTSADAGQTWSDTGLRESVYSLAVNQSVIYAGTSYGVMKNVGGSDWQPTSEPDGHSLFGSVVSLAMDPNDVNHVYAGSTNGFFTTSSGGVAWTADPVFYGATVMNIAMAASAPLTVYIASTFGSAATDDGGISWRQAGPGNASNCFAVDPLVPAIVFAGASMSADVFVSRISADGSSLEYSTYIGGTSSEWGSDIAVDSAGAAYVAGITQSEDFPVLNAFQPTAGGLMDVFVAKLSESGGLSYSTYLGGTLSDYNPRIAVDALGQAHVAGITHSANFPTAHAYQPTIGGGYGDVFVTALNQAGTGLVYSTFLGGNDQEVDTFGAGIAISPSGDTVVTGTTRSLNFPSSNAIQQVHGGGTDAFVTTFDPVGSLRYSTFLGGSGDDFGRQVAVDPTGSVVVVGATSSIDFPTRLALQPANAGAQDIFIARIDNAPAPADTTAPSTAVALSGTSGSNGWYRSAVQITLSAADNAGGSGVALVEYSINDAAYQRYLQPLSIAAQGATVVHARATDRAGNVETPSLTTVKIDSAAPTIDIAAPAAGEYLHSDVLHLSFTAIDTVSGVAAGSPSATFDGSPVANGQDVQLLDAALGSHALIVTASDAAGNAAMQTIAIRVTASVDSLIGAVNAFAARGQITSRIARNLLSKLSDAKAALQNGKVAAARSKLLDFRDDVAAHGGAEIAADAARLLIADVDDVLSRM